MAVRGIRNVSVIHGDYSEVEVDLSVLGPDTLTLSRFYTSRDSLELTTFGGWRFQPQTFFLIRPYPSRKPFQNKEGTFEYVDIFVGTPEGSVLRFSGWQNWENPEVRSKFTIDFDEEENGISNTARGGLSSFTNVKNHKLFYDGPTQSFELCLNSGGKRIFKQSRNPKKYQLSTEILPSRNKIFYGYSSKGQIQQIKMTNAEESKTISWIEFQHQDSIVATASDGSCVEYHFEKDPSGYRLLSDVNTTLKPLASYRYQVQGNQALLVCKELPEGRSLNIDYQQVFPYKVQSIADGEGVTTQFAYEEGSTEVESPIGQKTVYSYDDKNRLTSIQEYLNQNLYRTKRKSWGEFRDEGNLLAFSIEDGAQNTLYYKSFYYDVEGSILVEKEYGDLSGQHADPITFNRIDIPDDQNECHTKEYTYGNTPTEDTVSQLNTQGDGILYVYYPGTSILKRKEIHKRNRPKRRIYYEYNDDGVLTQIITDNGNTSDQNDVDYGHKKHSILIQPKQQLPNLGAPEIIEERYLDSRSGGEVSLKKRINHFDSHGQIVQQDFYNGAETLQYSLENQYDALGRLISTTDPLKTITTFAYDLNGNLTTQETKELIIHYQYDLQNNTLSITQTGSDGTSLKTEYAYDAQGNQTLERNPLGNETIYQYDLLGRLIKTAEPALGETSYAYEYDLFDNLTLISDPLQNNTIMKHNVRGKPSLIVQCDGRKESAVYSLDGNLCSYTGLDGITKTFEYDYLGRIKKIEYYEKGQLKDPFREDSYFFSAFRLESESTSEGKTKYFYNESGQLIQSLTAQKDSDVSWRQGISKIKNGEKIDYTHDSFGFLSGTKKWKDDTHFSLYTQEFDPVGRIIKKQIENEQGKILFKEEYTFNSQGDLSETVCFPYNQVSHLAKYTYDSFGRLTQLKKGKSSWRAAYQERPLSKKVTTNPIGCLSEETYNSAGLLTVQVKKDQNHSRLQEEQFQYDSLHHLLSEESSGHGSTYTYSPGGFLKSTTREFPINYQTTFRYNTYGENTHQTVPPFSEDICYEYDRKGNLVHISYQESPEEDSTYYTLSHDRYGKLTKAEQRGKFTLERQLNIHSQVLSESITDTWGTYITSYTFDKEGCLTDIVLPDSSSIHYSYEGPFVKKITRFSKDKKELYTYEVAKRDLMGNIQSEILPGKLGTRETIYDMQGRTLGITSDYFSDKMNFDLLSNPTQKETTLNGKTTHTLLEYDPLSQIRSEKGLFDISYAYGALGKPLRKDGPSHEYGDQGNIRSIETTHFQFDALGRLVSSKDHSGSVTCYTYDQNRRRLNKQHDQAERYFYIGNYELGALNKRGEIIALRIPNDPNALENTTVISIELKNTPYVPLSDLQENIRCLVHPEKQKVLESYQFSAFGEEKIFNSRREVSISPLGNPWRYQGKRHDCETDLIYYGARYYSPSLRQWISPDPLGTRDSLNLYLFCHNNPLKYTDPWGLATKIASGCGCVHHDHPGYSNRPPNCVCICGNEVFVKISGMIDGVASFTASTWNHPRFQGGLQAFGGLTETLIGAGMTLALPPVGGMVTAHGLDHFFTGLQTTITGIPHDTVTSRLLQKTGMPSHIASTTDGTLSIVGSTYGISAIRNAQRLTVPAFRLPNYQPVHNKITRLNKLGPHEKACGPHSSFKLNPLTNRVSGYETYDFNPITGKWSPRIRFRGVGSPYAKVEPPFILERQAGKGVGSTPIVPRKPSPLELPHGY